MDPSKSTTKLSDRFFLFCFFLQSLVTKNITVMWEICKMFWCIKVVFVLKEGWETTPCTQKSDSTGWKPRHGAIRWDYSRVKLWFLHNHNAWCHLVTREWPGCVGPRVVHRGSHISLKPGLCGMSNTASVGKLVFLYRSCINELQWPDVTVMTLFVYSTDMRPL